MYLNYSLLLYKYIFIRFGNIYGAFINLCCLSRTTWGRVRWDHPTRKPVILPYKQIIFVSLFYNILRFLTCQITIQELLHKFYWGNYYNKFPYEITGTKFVYMPTSLSWMFCELDTAVLTIRGFNIMMFLTKFWWKCVQLWYLQVYNSGQFCVMSHNWSMLAIFMAFGDVLGPMDIAASI